MPLISSRVKGGKNEPTSQRRKLAGNAFRLKRSVTLGWCKNSPNPFLPATLREVTNSGRGYADSFWSETMGVCNVEISVVWRHENGWDFSAGASYLRPPRKRMSWRIDRRNLNRSRAVRTQTQRRRDCPALSPFDCTLLLMRIRERARSRVNRFVS